MLDNAPLHWPKALGWMWTYCIYLGPYTSFTGDKYDLGIYISPHGGDKVSAAIVYGNEPSQYISGPLCDPKSDFMIETQKRAKACRLI